MFDNLVESSSHKDDITRKGSFIGITMLIYAVLIGVFFVVGIYLYDAHLSTLDLELTTLVAPVPVPQRTAHTARSPRQVRFVGSGWFLDAFAHHFYRTRTRSWRRRRPRGVVDGLAAMSAA